MHIAHLIKLDEFVQEHADAASALNKWVEKIEAEDYKTPEELRKAFGNNVSYLSNGRFKFKIRGNNYRLIAVVIFTAGTVIVRFIGTHAEYDKIDATNI